MDKAKLVELYLKGYEEGLKEAWKSAKSMVSHYEGWELKSRMEGKIGTLYQDVRSKRYDLMRDTSLLIEEEPEEIERGETSVEISPGGMYLIIEKKPNRSFDKFFQIVSGDVPGLLITKDPIETVVDDHGLRDAVTYVHLGKRTRRGSRGELSYPDISYGSLSKISSYFGEHFKNNQSSIALLHGVDRMLSYTDFEKVQKFMDFIREKAVSSKGTVIVSIPPDIMGKKQFNRFCGSFTEVFTEDRG